MTTFFLIAYGLFVALMALGLIAGLALALFPRFFTLRRMRRELRDEAVIYDLWGP